MESSSQARIALLACSVFEKEIPLVIKHHGSLERVHTRFFEMGLHDQPDILRQTLQDEIDALDELDGIGAIVLAYGLCGCGTTGLHSKKHTLIIPRAHDCITVFLGSKNRFSEHQSRCPGCMYYTPGWNRGRRVPGPDKLKAMRRELSPKFDAEDVDFLIESEQQAWSMHDTATYIDLGTNDADDEAQYAENCAQWLGWKFERLQGDPGLLRDLLTGPWPEDRFQTILPGHQLAHSADLSVMKSLPHGAKS
ncbi:DUF1638 domain-containing protein [Verrucomicrobiaceae bacterium N1E253]|uniref:DUF1638 domain-containing protein n=1 Tax=Oceaniferula marina TaxID=2748318 RepID=A0A851GHM8_9BACT|nr:DUF1638 domain-containing protein [Oceaniferula marina]NWK54120.1 DUF1638 domain-containing protein [Oceaniferula marina]